MWTWQDARKHTKIAFGAWDMSDQSGSEAYAIRTETISSLYCLSEDYQDLYSEVTNHFSKYMHVS